MKKDKVKQEWDEHRASIVKECAIWENLRVRGGQDPFWPDGVNMNLTRNHVIYAKRCLREMAERSVFRDMTIRCVETDCYYNNDCICTAPPIFAVNGTAGKECFNYRED